MIVFPDRTLVWPIQTFADLTAETLQPVMDAEEPLDVLLLGCGREMQLVPRQIRDAIRVGGAVIEAMDTGAAARTYNVLMAEERRVAAALIAVD